MNTKSNSVCGLMLLDRSMLLNYLVRVPSHQRGKQASKLKNIKENLREGK